MAINKYNVVESGNVSLGQVGSLLETSSGAVTGKKILAIQFLEDTVFTSLTPESGTNQYIGSTNHGGDSVASVTFPQGITVFGRWSGFQLSSGKVVAYLG